MLNFLQFKIQSCTILYCDLEIIFIAQCEIVGALMIKNQNQI